MLARTTTNATPPSNQFVDGFAESKEDNIDHDDLERFCKLAAGFLSYYGKQVAKLVRAGAWIEVECDGGRT